MAFSVNPYIFAASLPVGPAPSYSADTTVILPPNFSYARPSAGTYSTLVTGGKNTLVSASNGVPRFEYRGTSKIGLKSEVYCKNYSANFNANPTDLTGMTKGGDAAATLAVVADPGSYLTNAVYDYGNTIDLTGICTAGNLFFLDNTTGTTPAYAEIAGGPDSTSVFSMSCYIKANVAPATLSYGASTSSVPVPVTAALNRAKLRSFFPDVTTRLSRITVPAGASCYFILNQLEQWGFPTSVIVTAGAAAARQADTLSDTNIANRSYFSAAAGAVMGEFDLDDIDYHANTHFAILSNGTGLSDCLSAYMVAGRSRIKSRTATGGTLAKLKITANAGQGGTDIGTVDKVNATYNAGFTYTAGITGTPGNAVIITGCADTATYSLPNAFTNPLNRLDIGGRPFSEYMCGHVRSIKIWNVQPTVPQIGYYMNFANSFAALQNGQSNGAYKYGADAGNSGARDAFNDGEKSMVATLDQYLPASRNYVMHGAIGGASYVYASTTNSFYDVSTGTAQCLMLRVTEMAQCFINGGGKFLFGMCNQQETDITAPPSSIIAGFTYVWNTLRATIGGSTYNGGQLVVGKEMIGRRDITAGSDTGYQTHREIQRGYAAGTIASAPPNVVNLPERVDLDMNGNQVHLTDLGYQAEGPRDIRKMLYSIGFPVSGPVDGPQILTATRTGAQIVFKLVYPTGITGVTPTSGTGANGPFRYYDTTTSPSIGGAPSNEITVSNWSMTSATDGIINLTGTPTHSSAGGTLYYIFGECYRGAAIDRATFLRGNDAYQIPARSATMSLPYTAATGSGDFASGDFNPSDFSTGTTSGDFNAADFNNSDLLTS